ncbi:hypothetical protein AAFF_G00432990 [Aldrovandia affinis]|uniref:Uncharacterized protein n=1 Tax=Aldrovandia affinis TaxID=143900 RepID=A0AAD7S8G9_9TELE|nr:hypothetical protein AAFF_G00432990 [Aldrovandia affinis]
MAQAETLDARWLSPGRYWHPLPLYLNTWTAWCRSLLEISRAHPDRAMWGTGLPGEASARGAQRGAAKQRASVLGNQDICCSMRGNASKREKYSKRGGCWPEGSGACC